MNTLLFIIVVGLWSIEGIKSWNHKHTKKAMPKPARKRNHVPTYQYIDGVAYEDLPGGWTLEA